MKVMIEGSTKEIVDLVVEVQDRLSEENYKNFFAPITIDDGDITIGGEEISKIISEVTSDDTQNKNMNRNEIIKELEKQLQLLSKLSESKRLSIDENLRIAGAISSLCSIILSV